MTYLEMFEKATGNEPYPYQERLAGTDPEGSCPELPQLLDVPTG